MSNLIQYRPLFAVQLLQEYYLPRDESLFLGLTADQRQNIEDRLRRNYQVARDFKISPTQHSREKLANHGLIFKTNNFGFVVASKVNSMGDGTFVPFLPLTESLGLQFTLELQNKHAVNFSNLRMEEDIENKDHFLYYFSNRANNVSPPDTLYLSQPVPEFDAAISYESGEVIIDNSDPLNPEMLEAVENSGPGPFDAAQWLQIFGTVDPLPQFVTNMDRIVVRPSIFKHAVDDAAQENLVARMLDFSGAEVLQIPFSTSEPGTPINEIELDLSEISSAYYELEIQDTNGAVFSDLGLRFYKDDLLFVQRPFGLIECFHEPDGSLNDYRWLDQNNEDRLLSPTYTIALKNRSTFWRYYYADPPAFTSTQMEVFELPPGNPIDRILVSNQPLGLTQFGRNVQIDISGDVILLPNPGISSIFPENGKVYSEINMGGGYGPPA